jgi:Pyridoxamine 5'-phosphate oxidase
MLATLRKDGSPRISPVEPYFIGDHLLLGMMWRSMKALDLLRDARLAIHSAITNAEGNEGEFKLRGRAVELTEERYYQAIRERWGVQSSTRLHVFSIDIQSASFIAYDIGKSEMIVKQWDLQQGLKETRRTYP